MKNIFLVMAFFGLFTTTYTHAQHVPASIYSIKLEALSGGNIDLSKYKGKKILIVNTASKCGYTPQYEALEKLYEQYKDKLVIIGCPANNFLFQEPGSNTEIAQFCTKNYGVSFPMAAKIDVKGKGTHPLYLWLTQKKFNHVADSKVSWNFQKYLISENGELITSFAPGVDPLSAEIVNAIKLIK
jgi:glutathione peroxidase